MSDQQNTQQPAQAGEVTPEQIEALIKKHARGLYSSSQLDWEIADFHRFGLLQLIDAILALRPQAVPMTPEQIMSLLIKLNSVGAESPTQALTMIIREVEAHHFGILPQAEGGV